MRCDAASATACATFELSFDRVEPLVEHAPVTRQKALSIPEGESEVLRLFQRIARDWKPYRDRREGPEGVASHETPAATTELDGDAVRDLLLAMMDALSGTTGWAGVRRAHDALKEKHRDVTEKRARVVGVVTWALWAWSFQREREQRLRVVEMLRRGLLTEDRKFSRQRLSDADVMAILDARKPHEKSRRIAARLAFKAGLFRTVSDAFDAYKPKR